MENWVKYGNAMGRQFILCVLSTIVVLDFFLLFELLPCVNDYNVDNTRILYYVVCIEITISLTL